MFNTAPKWRNYPDKPIGRGPAALIVPYMKGNADLQRPLMVNSESVVRQNFGNEQYAKTATALNILRETVMDPNYLIKPLREYAERWLLNIQSQPIFSAR